MPATNYQLPTPPSRWLVPQRTEPTIVDQLLKNRSITDPDRFFHPNYERDQHDPFLLPDMTAAVERILRALARHERFAVYADYDADGIPGGALLTKVLRANGADVVTYIPDREREGYGLHDGAIASLSALSVSLIITVDLGITNDRTVRHARERGIDVIVTDHHTVDPARVPHDAVGRVHPALPGSQYPFAGLAGGGVAWKLAQALASQTGQPSPTELKWLLELPAISTVCDLVPLTDENRTIVRFGLTVLQRTRSVGLAALSTTAGIDPALITERTIGFQIGPRLNAPGRIDHANRAMALLLSTDPVEAASLARSIEQQNQERQLRLAGVIAEAMEQVRAYGTTLPSALVVSGTGWPVGVLGLAASRLVEQTHRPVIVLSVDRSGTATGSGRGIEGFDLLGGIHRLTEHLMSYGGHPRAAGLKVRSGSLETFRTGFEQYAAQSLDPQQLRPQHRAEASIMPADVTTEFVRTLEQFAPFGMGNPVPQFVVEPLTISTVRAVGADGAHLRLNFRELPGGAIGFRLGSRAAQFTTGDRVAVLGSLHRSTWNGAERIELHLTDLKSAAQ